jgi:hypothetical protein
VSDELRLGEGRHREASVGPATAADAVGPPAERQLGFPVVGGRRMLGALCRPGSADGWSVLLSTSQYQACPAPEEPGCLNEPPFGAVPMPFK